MASGLGGGTFRPDVTEKVSRLLLYLDELGRHPQTRNALALHGGTALNLFVLDGSRMSLDMDVNYIGDVSADELAVARPPVELAVENVAREQGYRVEAGPSSHAGRTYKFVYGPRGGGRDFIKVDLDFMNRTPLLAPTAARASAAGATAEFPINAPLEVAAGKVSAILTRVVPRDLYDISELAANKARWTSGDDALDHSVMMFYTAMTASFPKPVDFRTRFLGREREFESILWPVLPAGMRPTAEELTEKSAGFLEWATTPRTPEEQDFVDLMRRAEYKPELLFSDYPSVLENAAASPAMKWKVQNLRKAVGN